MKHTTALKWIVSLAALMLLATIASSLLRIAHEQENYTIQTHVDPGTGCHYIVTKGAVFPRMNADGKHLCLSAVTRAR